MKQFGRHFLNDHKPHKPAPSCTVNCRDMKRKFRKVKKVDLIVKHDITCTFCHFAQVHVVGRDNIKLFFLLIDKEKVYPQNKIGANKFQCFTRCNQIVLRFMHITSK